MPRRQLQQQALRLQQQLLLYLLAQLSKRLDKISQNYNIKKEWHSTPFIPFYSRERGLKRGKCHFFRKKSQKSWGKIWWNQIFFVPLHSLKRNDSSKQANMVDVVQLVRASDCGSECRGFESHLPPKINPANRKILQGFLFIIAITPQKLPTPTPKKLLTPNSQLLTPNS